ncbi:hypothetical protein [Streptomyces sp. NPDC048191]|uniref:hypothetical protein n=1 Tax=Streptomyces sp. NPDC048191 TaxID=3155484 RepID=UPI0033E2BBC7
MTPDAKWTGWAPDAVLVLIVVQLSPMGGHLFLGRAALCAGLGFRRRCKRRERGGADVRQW